MSEEPVAAEMLQGLELEGGWKVIEKVERKPRATGGNFSIGYIVDLGGKKAFLKALDFYDAITSSKDPMEELRNLFNAYTYEKNLLVKCGENKMNRVTIPLAHGKIEVPSVKTPFLNQVYYIIFDLADGDSRSQLDAIDQFDVAWRLRALYNVALGLFQLHKAAIAHQDIKPSNVLTFANYHEKVGDLGRAADHSIVSPYEDWQFPGDWSYAPIEHYYSYIFSDWRTRRIGTDLYMFGSLIHYFFTRTAMTPSIMTKLDVTYKPRLAGGSYGGTFAEALPYIQAARDEVLQTFEEDINMFTGAPGPILLRMVKELTEPDPLKRGHPRDKNISELSMERYVSELNTLHQRFRRDW